MSYDDYIGAKLASAPPTGIDAAHGLPGLFPHQDDLTAWALRRGRCAIFADTGLGKTRMQIAWANTVHRETGRDCLILAPLAVAPQTVAEGESMGVTITHCLDGADVRPGITSPTTNACTASIHPASAPSCWMSRRASSITKPRR